MISRARMTLAMGHCSPALSIPCWPALLPPLLRGACPGHCAAGRRAFEEEANQGEEFYPLDCACKGAGYRALYHVRPARIGRRQGNGINELYFSRFKGPARGPVDPDLASAANGAPNLQALCDNLSATRTQGRCYRSLALDAALKQLGSGQYFVERDNALVVFLGGVVDLADKLARKHGLANPEDLDVRQIDAGVGSILNSLTTGERNAVKLRLGDFLAESAEQVTTFAHEQASRVPGGHLGHPLALLGVGTRMVEALLRRLELEPLAPSSVAHVGELAVDELAALSRLLMPPDVHTPKV